MKVLIIYHSACADGSFAAAITALAYKDEVCHFFAANYAPNNGDIVDAQGVLLDQRQDIMRTNPIVEHEAGKEPVYLEGFEYDKVIVVDFSLSERQMAVFTKRFGTNFIVLDHHNVRTRERYAEECQKLDVHPNPEMIFNASGSGALLAYMKNLSRFNGPSYNRFLGNLIRIAQMVSDRDTWQRSVTKAFEFYEGYVVEMFAHKEEVGVLFEEQPHTVRIAREVIMFGDIEEIRATGRERIVERNKRIKHLVDNHSLFSNGTGSIAYNHVVLPVERSLGSEAAHFVLEEYDHFQLVVMPRISKHKPDTVFISCRSKDQAEDSPCSAKQIAMLFGGNGHANAAGWQMPRADFEALYPEIQLEREQTDAACC